MRASIAGALRLGGAPALSLLAWFGAGWALLTGEPLASGRAAAQSKIEGVEGWADAVVGRSTTRWDGQRVDFPEPQARPPSLGQLHSLSAPVSVHLAPFVSAARAQAVLRSAETAYALLRAAGLFDARGDAGQAQTWGRDLYLTNSGRAGAFLDATEPVSDTDGARAFALVDARLPQDRLLACTAEALIEAELFELDPAESEVVRKGSAAYFAWLTSGESCDAGARESACDGATDPDAPAPLPRGRAAARAALDASEKAVPSFQQRGVLREPALFFAFLRALGARMDRNRGAFVQNMWHFARQRTWEGSGLRGSPDLLEAIGKSLELSHTKLEEIAGELANLRALEHTGEVLCGAPRLSFGGLPTHLAPVSPPLAPLDSAFLLVDLEGPKAGKQLKIWAHGEVGPRWVLSAARLDARGTLLASVHAPVRKYPESELLVELDASTRFVLISITNLANGLPDPDLPSSASERSVRLIVDAAR